ncbi:MAG: DUF1549 domain-containing protein, partial [Isosphaeraceae bacterium]|nr:DUF1549 domain-containing protein [Isosphaeraceae bacterium]
MKPSSVLVVGSFLLAGTVRAGEAVDYTRDVKPILTRQCTTCHGAIKPRAGLRLDTAEAAVKGNKQGPSIVPGRSDESPLIAAVLGEGNGERMPLKRPPLSEKEVAALRAWIDQGAKHPADEQPATAAHWAFVPPVRPVEPAVKDTSWPRQPIDRFILDRLERANLTRSPEADKVTLIRRLSLDLIGLPPTPR